MRTRDFSQTPPQGQGNALFLGCNEYRTVLDMLDQVRRWTKLARALKHAPGYLAKVITAAASGLLLNVFTDPFLGYFRNVYIFGQEYTIAKALTKITGGVTLVNSVASTVCVVLLYLALRPALERASLLPKAQKASEPKADK